MWSSCAAAGLGARDLMEEGTVVDLPRAAAIIAIGEREEG